MQSCTCNDSKTHANNFVQQQTDLPTHWEEGNKQHRPLSWLSPKKATVLQSPAQETVTGSPCFCRLVR